MVGSASTKRRRTQSEDSPSSVGDSKKLRKSQQSVSSASKRKKRVRPGSNSGEEATVQSPSRRKQPSRSASRGPSPAVSPLPPKHSSTFSPRRPSPSVSLHPVDEEASGAPISVGQPSASVPQNDSLQSPKQSLVPLAQSSPLLAESSPSSLRNTTYPERLTTPSDSMAMVDIDPSCSTRIAIISKRPVESSFQKKSLPRETYSHKKDVTVWWAKKVALILVLSLAFLSLVIVSWKLYLKDHEQSQMDYSVRSFYDNSHVKLLLRQLQIENEEMDVLDKRQQKVSDGVHALRSQLMGYIEQLSALEGEINKQVPSSREELEAGNTVAQQFLKETIAMEEEVRADLQMVMDEVVLNSGEAYLKELEVIGETLLQPASDEVNELSKKIQDMEAVASTNKERLLRLGGTLEGLYEALEKKGTLQNLNSWLTRARDVQKIALKLQVERAHSLVTMVVAEMTSWALNAIIQDNGNNSFKSNQLPSKEDVEGRIAELLDSSLGGEVGEGGGVDMAARQLGGSILYHSLYTSPEYVAPTNLLPFTQWVLRKLRIPGRAVPKPPETAISESKQLGDCWAFPGDKGRLTIKLAVPIIVSSVSLEYMPGESNMNKVSSAPKDFSIDGWSGNPLEPFNKPLRLIEGAQYSISSFTSTQLFQVEDGQKLNGHVQYVTLNVESNHGNSNFTCIYQFHVHGSQKYGGSTPTSPNCTPL